MELLGQRRQFLVALDASDRVDDRLTCSQGVHVGAVDVVDPVADRILKLRLQDTLGTTGNDGTSLAFVRNVERVGDVGINLARAARRRP
jgi:hypothetical protein